MAPRNVTPIETLETHPEPYVTVAALCAYFQIDPRTLVRKWILEGQLRACRFGRMWRIKTTDARAFELANRSLPVKRHLHRIERHDPHAAEGSARGPQTMGLNAPTRHARGTRCYDLVRLMCEEAGRPYVNQAPRQLTKEKRRWRDT